MIVAFDLAGFRARYPAFCGLSDALLGSYFVEAGLYLNNTDCSVVQDTAQRSLLLNLLVAHIATLNNGADGQGASGLVGRVNSAAEGSVSVGVDLGALPGSAAWFAQTQAGLAYWQATAQFRTMRYVPGPQYVPDPYGQFGNWGYGR